MQQEEDWVGQWEHLVGHYPSVPRAQSAATQIGYQCFYPSVPSQRFIMKKSKEDLNCQTSAAAMIQENKNQEKLTSELKNK